MPDGLDNPAANAGNANADVAPNTPEVPQGDNQTTPETPETPDAPAAQQTAPKANPEGEGAATPSDMPKETYFNGTAVEVDIPSELQEALDAAGADTGKIVSELFAKDSSWELSEETRKPLDEKFGKGIVDSYLAAIKAQNEAAVMQFKSEQENLSKAEAELVEWSNELMGGEDAWKAAEEWASKSLSEEDIDNFNAAMQSGNKFIQQLAIENLKQRWRDEVGDLEYSLTTADATSTDTGDNTPLSSEGYIKAISELSKLPKEERQKAEAVLDARRRAGMARGL